MITANSIDEDNRSEDDDDEDESEDDGDEVSDDVSDDDSVDMAEEIIDEIDEQLNSDELLSTSCFISTKAFSDDELEKAIEIDKFQGTYDNNLGVNLFAG